MPDLARPPTPETGNNKKAQSKGTRIVMATHDFGQAKRLANDVYFMHHGLIHEYSADDSFFQTPMTAEAKAFINGDILL